MKHLNILSSNVLSLLPANQHVYVNKYLIKPYASLSIQGKNCIRNPILWICSLLGIYGSDVGIISWILSFISIISSARDIPLKISTLYMKILDLAYNFHHVC